MARAETGDARGLRRGRAESSGPAPGTVTGVPPRETRAVEARGARGALVVAAYAGIRSLAEADKASSGFKI